MSREIISTENAPKAIGPFSGSGEQTSPGCYGGNRSGYNIGVINFE